MMNIINWLPLIYVLSISSSKIIHNIDEYLQEPPIIDLTSDGAEVTLYVRLCEWSSMNGSQTILNMTRYCYCEESELNDPESDSCSMPGPTLVMHEETVINVTVINELVGAGHLIPSVADLYHNRFKDLDMTNLHVHGLHVSPEIDDVLVEIFPAGGSHSYPYDFSYHYPGTFWYHAHHHGATTWQVNMGLHGALLMESDDDTTNDTYEENVLLFEWFYIIPYSICNPGMLRTCNGSDTVTDTSYSPRFETYVSTSELTGLGSNYAMCDIYCSFDYSQRQVSGYVYDVATDLDVNETHILSGELDDELMYYFTNGQISPKIAVTTGVFRRLRMINALTNWYLQFEFPSECEWYLIATDGVYISGEYMNYNLSQASHNNQYIISPGGRADFMVKCINAGSYDIKSTEDNTQDPDNLENLNERIIGNRVLFILEVTDGEIPDDGTDELPASVPSKEAGTYLESLLDLTGEDEELNTECDCNYMDPDNTECEIYFGWDGNFTYGNVNGKEFGIGGLEYPYNEDALMILKYDEAYEYFIDNGKGAHVYHQHINPYQVQNDVGENGFIALEGTWWDTLGNVPQSRMDYIRMRFWTRDYMGLYIGHCHLLQHEDKGMMGFFTVLDEIPSICPNQNLSDTTMAPMTNGTVISTTDDMVDVTKSLSSTTTMKGDTSNANMLNTITVISIFSIIYIFVN